MSSSKDMENLVDGFEYKVEIGDKEEIVCRKRSRGKLGKTRKETYNEDDDEDSQYKSKNLHAERRRRARLGSNLLHLRSLVPIITNMNKDTIVKDAITYIKELQSDVKRLSDELLEMDGSDPLEETKIPRDSDLDAHEQMEDIGIEADVRLNRIGANKLWMKVIFAKKIGRLTRVMEAVHDFGYLMTDMSFTTTRGASTFTSCLEEMFGVFRSEEETRKMLLGIIRSN